MSSSLRLLVVDSRSRYMRNLISIWNSILNAQHVDMIRRLRRERSKAGETRTLLFQPSSSLCLSLFLLSIWILVLLLLLLQSIQPRPCRKLNHLHPQNLAQFLLRQCEDLREDPWGGGENCLGYFCEYFYQKIEGEEAKANRYFKRLKKGEEKTTTNTPFLLISSRLSTARLCSVKRARRTSALAFRAISCVKMNSITIR